VVEARGLVLGGAVALVSGTPLCLSASRARPEEIASAEWWLTGEPAVPLHGAVIDASMGLSVRPGLLSQDAAAPVKEVLWRPAPPGCSPPRSR
jgi:hypothetical protein